MKTRKIATDSLGFPLQVEIRLGQWEGRGKHLTVKDATTGEVPVEAKHAIEINRTLVGDELIEVIAHEAYHLIFSIRKHITVDEETETEVYGQLVKRIHVLVEEMRNEI